MKEDVLSSTKAKLIDIMKCDGEISVEQGATTLDLATTTVRQHLSKLEEQEFVKTRHKRYGRGRPLKMYSLTEKSDVWYENTEPRILAGLIGYLEAHDQSELVEDFFEEVVEDWLQSFEAFTRDRSGTRTELLCEFMERKGFMPDCEAMKEEEVGLTLCHCPCRLAAESSSIPCQKEKRFIEEVLGEDVERTRWIASGDTVCEYRLANSETES